MEPVSAAVTDVEDLAVVFARAFADDPMARWRRPRSTLEETTDYYRSVLHEYVEAGVLCRIDACAAAAWLSPRDAHLLHESRARRRRAADTVGVDTTSSALWGWLDSHLPDEPVWFLELIAVAPETQHSGLGGLLVTHGLTRARDMGHPAFLQTSNERNLAFYQSHGFRIIDEGNAPPDGPTVWFMQTESPRSPSP
jgi:ribosomal protein S18 acetylase RimI-like enzyme